MALLFTLSGMATRLLSDRTSPETLLTRRWRRLLPPILLGVVFLVPIQEYVVLKARLGYGDGFVAFLGHYFSPDREIAVDGVRHGLPLFLYLWYLGYLALYTLLIATALKWAPATVGRLDAMVRRRFAGPGLIAWPLVFLVLLRTLLYPLAEPGSGLNELYRHLAFCGLFLFGFLIGGAEAVWDAFVRYRWLALGMAAAAAGLFGYFTLTAGQGDGDLAELRHPVLHLIRPVEVWGSICAVFGFGRLHLRGSNAVLRYLSPAVLTAYVLHHPVVILSAFLLRGFHLARPVEALLILLITVAACIAGYEAVRRLTPLLERLGRLPPRPVEQAA